MASRIELTTKARSRRRKPTGAQAYLWMLIRDHEDRRSRRQVAISQTIVHFVLPRRNLLINVFGPSMMRTDDQAERLRGLLTSFGFYYLELTDAQVLNSPSEVIALIESFEESEASRHRYLTSKRAAGIGDKKERFGRWRSGATRGTRW